MWHKDVIVFCKAQLSSLIATACDFVVTSLLFFATQHVMLSTATGAVTGGVVNCIVNYRWTFAGTQHARHTVAWRYLLVWIGSITLNTFGTDWGVRMCQMWMPQQLWMVLTVKAVVAILVAVFWNYLLQKKFVY